MASMSESRSQTRFFAKEYIPGKGMRTGGYGDLIVGNHYKVKNQQEVAQLEKQRSE